MRVTVCILAFILLALPSPCMAQRQNNIWYFGNSAGIDFNGSSPQALTDGKMLAPEGCASIADRITGRPLFYTNGEAVWNRDHVVMPNGTGLNGHPSSLQSAVILPVPGDRERYYIFTTDARERNLTAGLQYSVVDMRSDLGRGDVVILAIKRFAKLRSKCVIPA